MIQIIEKNAKNLPGISNLFIKINYDKELLSQLKKITQSRYYHIDTYEWEFPLIKLKEIIDICSWYDDIEVKLLDKNKEYTISIPVDYKFKLKPFKHQEEAIIRGINEKSWILGDEQGLGKTASIIHTAAILKKLGLVKQVLIICGTSSIKDNWLKDIDKHSYESGYILGTRYRKNGRRYIGALKERIEDLDKTEPLFLITNIESIRNKKFIEKLKLNKNINFCAIDEAHKANNIESNQGENLQLIDHFEYKIPITGTLLMNNPLDPYAMLKWAGLEKTEFKKFKLFYTKWRTLPNGEKEMSYKNLNVLRDQLDQVMLRRLKKDVLDLPPKLYIEDYVEMGPEQQELYDAVRAKSIEDFELNFHAISSKSLVTRLRQVTSFTGTLSKDLQTSAKLDRLGELLETIVSQNDKAIIFADYRETVDEIARRFPQYNPVKMYGGMSDEETEQSKESFMEDNNCKIIVGIKSKLGVSHTLTAGRYVILVDEPWTKGELEQMSDRAHRIGTTDTVYVISLITLNTIDERVHEIIETKSMYSDMLIDDRELPKTEKAKEILKFLLNID